MPFANPRPFDELSASNQRSIAKKTKRKVKVLKMPRITETGRRPEVKGTVFKKIWTKSDPNAPMKKFAKKRA
jgi:hypothetical protein